MSIGADKSRMPTSLCLPEQNIHNHTIFTNIHVPRVHETIYTHNLRQNRPEYVINMGESCTLDNLFETSFSIICQVIFFSIPLPSTIIDDFNFPGGKESELQMYLLVSLL